MTTLSNRHIHDKNAFSKSLDSRNEGPPLHTECGEVSEDTNTNRKTLWILHYTLCVSLRMTIRQNLAMTTKINAIKISPFALCGG